MATTTAPRGKLTTLRTAGQGSLLGRAVNIVAAEWIKLRSLRSTYVLLGSAAVAALLVAVLSCNSVAHHWAAWSPEEKAAYDPLPASFQGFTLAQLAFAVLGVLTMSSEYSSGLIRTTLTAIPGRRAVLAAKTVVLASTVFVCTAITAVVCFLVGQALLAPTHAGLRLFASLPLRAVLATAVHLTATALLGLALATLVRHAAGSIALTVALVYIVPAFLVADRGWMLTVYRSLPGTAFGRLISTYPTHHAPSVYASWLAVTLYPLVLLTIAGVTLQRRDS